MKHKRESLAEAIRNQKRAAAKAGRLRLGHRPQRRHFSGNQGPPTDEEGRRCAAIRRALNVAARISTTGRQSRRHGPGEPTQWWFRKWIDPTGENTQFSGVDSKRRGIQSRNLGALLLPCREPACPGDERPQRRRAACGRDKRAVIRQAPLRRNLRLVEAYGCREHRRYHHLRASSHAARDDCASGPWRDLSRSGRHLAKPLPRLFPNGTERRFVSLLGGWQADAQAFENYLARTGMRLIFGSRHTHTNPDDRKGGRSHIERMWDVNFINCCALSRITPRRRPCL